MVQKKEEKKEKNILLEHRFKHRITIAKNGKESFKAGDYAGALKNYNEYLDAIHGVRQLTDIFSIKPSHLDPDKDITETLLIGHIYFEMARIYDSNPKFKTECQKCLEQFVTFSVNQPFQVLNSEMIRRYIRKTNLNNKDYFLKSFQQIQSKSAKCYLATHCFSPQSREIVVLRKFKSNIQNYNWGLSFISYYYRLSSPFTNYLSFHPRINKILTPFIRQPLKILTRIISKI